MNKRGFIFTFISVVLISVLMLAFLIQYTSRTKTDIERTNTEVETMNSFVKSLNNDYLPRALEISGSQAIHALLNYTGDREQYITQVDGEEEWDIKNVIVNAMVDGEYENGFGSGEHGDSLEIMISEGLSYKLNDTLEEIKNLGNATGITLVIDDVTDPNIKSHMNVFQQGPWDVSISMEISYSILNKDGSVMWEYENKEIITNISILNNFADPVYMIADPNAEDDGILLTINKTTYDLPGEVDPHVENTNFLACNQAPSFLDRIQGKTDASSYGIESMVNVKSNVLSAIDYQYILGIGPQLIEIWDSGYYIDSSHSDCYDLGDE